MPPSSHVRSTDQPKILHRLFDRSTTGWPCPIPEQGGILGKAMNAVLVERMNEKNAERLLENLKLVSEATP